MKKTICILCALTVLAALCGTASCEQTGPDLYHIGLEVTGLMGEIAGNEAYLSAFGRPETWTEVREAADTGDYDQPTAVYSVRLEDAEGYVREMFAADDETRELWENLPEELTQQLLYRVTPATFCNMANGRAGVASISFASFASLLFVTRPKTSTHLWMSRSKCFTHPNLSLASKPCRDTAKRSRPSLSNRSKRANKRP